MNVRSQFAWRGTCAALALVLAQALPATARTLAAIDALAALPAANPVARSAQLTATRMNDATVQTEPRFGVPTFLWGTTASATLKALQRTPSAKTSLDAEGTARAHLRDLADLYQITTSEVDALSMHNLQRLPNGAAIVRFRNPIDGIEVFREQANVLLDKRGGMVAVGGFVMGAPANQRKSAQLFATTPQQAIATALADYGFPSAIADHLQAAGEHGGYALLALPPGVVSDDGSVLEETARVKRVWFRLPTGLAAAYYVEVRVRDGNLPRGIDYYAYVVSAADGAVLFRHNQTADVAYSYRVYAEPTGANLPLPSPAGRNGFPHPTGTPDGYQAPLVAPNLITLQNAPFSKNDPWLPPGANRTIGNNVDAFADGFDPDNFNPPATDECNLALPIDGNLHACTNAANTFDYVYDTNQAPQASRTQVMAVVTNLFYMNNYLHDWFYDAGFDEAAGNAQTSNYGRGGIGLDSIYAEAQDFSGTNNANMSIPADGQRPRMRMFLWTSSIALTKVNAPASIAGVKQSGTADFGPQAFDLTGDLVLARDAANTAGPTTTDGCTAFTNAAAVAGKIAVIDRGVCLFVEKAKNAQNSEVHNTGEVWASMLWECYSNLLNDTARLTFAQAQDRMKRYLVGGLKMTPTDPTFISARDALLAVMQAQDPQDHDLCLRGFAKRGAGVGAVAPDNFSEDNAGVIESFKAVFDPGVKSVAIEYYHAVFDHYFITNIADEITKLDNGTLVGWTRTVESFNVYSDTPAGSSGVCRFFSTSFTPKSSHFYTASGSECATVKQNPNWQFEGVVFTVPTPDLAGNCPAGTLPVYRLYNNGQGAAPNHRFTTSLDTRVTMLAKGWLPEGNGIGVSMCSPT